MLFSIPKKRRNWLPVVSVFVFIFVISGFYFSSNQLYSTNSSQSYQILERALNRSITQCYALEGSYPPSLEYLKNNYGLTYNANQFFVDYKYIGSNLRPDITIIERE